MQFESLQRELQVYQGIQEKVEDLTADKTTLQMTNHEFKNTLKARVKEISSLQRDNEML